MKLTPKNDDNELWQSMLDGDKRALEKLFRRHYEMLFNYGLKLTRQEDLAKDGIQEVFAYLWEKRHSLSNRVVSVPAYLLISLRRLLLKTVARNVRRKNAHQEYGKFRQDKVFSFEDLLILEEQRNSEKKALLDALGHIPPRLREALYLKTYNGLTYKEIAKIMDISPQVARNYVSEAFHRLRELFLPKL